MSDVSNFYQDKITADHGTYKYKWFYNIVAFDDRYILVSNFLNNYLRGKSLKVLDVACGTGIYERMLDKNVRKDQNIIGVDISGPHIAINKQLGTFDEILEVNIENGLSFKNESFDVVILSEIIEHIFEPEKLIRECFRVLNKGGIIILTTPNLCSLQNRFSFGIFGNSFEIDYFRNFQHIRFYSKKALNKIFSDIFGKKSLIYQRGCACLFFYPDNFPFYLPFPRFLQKICSILFPNSGSGFLKVYKK